MKAAVGFPNMASWEIQWIPLRCLAEGGSEHIEMCHSVGDGHEKTEKNGVSIVRRCLCIFHKLKIHKNSFPIMLLLKYFRFQSKRTSLLILSMLF